MFSLNSIVVPVKGSLTSGKESAHPCIRMQTDTKLYRVVLIL